MSTANILLGAGAVALGLAMFLDQRRQHRLWQRHDEGQGWTCTAFDASRLISKLDRIRRNHRSVLKSTPQAFQIRQRLFASAREAVARLAFFDRPTARREVDQQGTLR